MISFLVVSSACIAVAVTVWLTRMALGGRPYGEADAGTHAPPVGWQPSVVLPVVVVVAGIRGGRSELAASDDGLRLTSDAVSTLWVARDEVESIRVGRGIRAGSLRFSIKDRTLRWTWVRPLTASAVDELRHLGWPVTD